MVIQSTSKRSGVIAILVDERLSRERGAILTRVINSLRQFVKVELLSGSFNEDQLIKKIETGDYDLVLLPWYRYLSWSRAEALWGLTRTSGPTLAGYFCEQLMPYEIGDQAEHLRAIFLDFANLQTSEIQTVFKSLHKDLHRSGIKPMIDPDAKIYVENWYGSQGLGNRIDSVLGLSEFQDPTWAKRANSIRICLGALWSMVYETAAATNVNVNNTKAYFQVAADRETALFRLCYSMPHWTPKDALTTFWPNPKLPSAPAQLLMKYSDFVRVHTIAGSSDVEIVVGFFPSAVAEQAHGQVHTLWVEPIAANLFTEALYEVPNPTSPRLRPLPHGGSHVKDSKENLSAMANVIELQTLLSKKEAVIQELKSGGVGTSSPIEPPDAESLLEAFQERYFDARFQIRQLELEIVALETRGGTEHEMINLRQKMAALANREQAWIKKLASTIETYRSAKTEAGKK